MITGNFKGTSMVGQNSPRGGLREELYHFLNEFQGRHTNIVSTDTTGKAHTWTVGAFY